MNNPYFKILNKYNVIQFVILIVLVIISNGLVFFDTGLHLSDWLLVNSPTENRLLEFFQNENQLLYYTLLPLYKDLDYGYVYKSIVFVYILIIPILFYRIVERLNLLEKKELYLITMLFAVYPANYTKFLYTEFLNSTALFLFFLSFYLSISNYKKNASITTITYILFYCSFYNFSVFVFYSVFLGYRYYWQIYKEHKTQLEFIRWNLGYLLLPVVYIVGQELLFQKQWIVIENESFLKMIGLSFKESLLKTMSFSIEKIGEYKGVNLFIVLGLFYSIYLFVFTPNKRKRKNKDRLYFVLSGILLFGVGALGANLKGYLPMYKEYNTAFQILIPVGASIVYYFVLTTLFELVQITERIQLFLFAMLITIFVFVNIRTNLAFLVESYKSLTIQTRVIENKFALPSKFLVKEYDPQKSNLFGRAFYDFEMNGMLKQIGKMKTKMKVIVDDMFLDEYFKRIQKNQIHRIDRDKFLPKKILLLNRNGMDFSFMNTLKLMRLEKTNLFPFHSLINQIFFSRIDEYFGNVLFESDFRSYGDSNKYLKKGWSNTERLGTWTIGKQAELSIPLSKPVQKNLEMILLIRYVFKRQLLIFTINGEEVDELEVSKPGVYKLKIPRKAIKNKKLDIKIETPNSHYIPNDPRELGVFVERLILVGE